MNSINKEAKCMFLSFIYFANLLEHNVEIDERLKKLYRTLAQITRMYKHRLEDIVEDINEQIKDYPTTQIDILLASVSIIAEYYEQTSGRKRLFTPMTHKDIYALQLELLDNDETINDNTLTYCRHVVEKLLR